MTKPNENPAETSENIDANEINTLKAEITALKSDIEALELTVKCILQGVLKVESKFFQKFMARGEFYGVEFK